MTTSRPPQQGTTSYKAPVPNHPCGVCQGPGAVPDDHPMIHVGPDVNWVAATDANGMPLIIHRDPSFHFDCLPPEYEALLKGEDGNVLPQHANTYAAILEARRGTRGEQLRQYIHDYAAENGSDNDVLPESEPQDG